MKYNFYMVKKLEGGAWKCTCCDKTYSKETKKSKHQKTPKHLLNYDIFQKERQQRLRAVESEE